MHQDAEHTKMELLYDEKETRVSTRTTSRQSLARGLKALVDTISPYATGVQISLAPPQRRGAAKQGGWRLSTAPSNERFRGYFDVKYGLGRVSLPRQILDEICDMSYEQDGFKPSPADI